MLWYMEKRERPEMLLKIYVEIREKYVLMDEFRRTSHPDLFYKEDVCKDITKFKGNHQCQSLFLHIYRVAGLHPVILFKNRLRYLCFPGNFTYLFWKTPWKGCICVGLLSSCFFGEKEKFSQSDRNVVLKTPFN